MLSPSFSVTAAGILTPVTAAHAILISIILYYAFDWPGSLDSVAKSCWAGLVFLTPSRFVAALDPTFSAAQTREHGSTGATNSYRTEKSNAMRRILNLDRGGVTNLVQKRRVFSNAVQQPNMALPGLANWDNSCYQNSVLQGLASLRSLPPYLENPADRTADTTRSTLLDLTTSLNDKTKKGTTLRAPAKLKNMSTWQQQDAQEYFCRVLDEIDQDTAGIIAEERKKRSEQGLSMKYKSPVKAGQHNKSTGSPLRESKPPRLHELPAELQMNLVRNPLEGLLAQRVGCSQCNYVEGLSLVPFTCLTVPLGKDIFYDIRECLNEFTALEPIEGVDCAKCTLLSVQSKLVEMLKRNGSAHGGTQHSDLLKSLQQRLGFVEAALESHDYTEASLKKCQIGAKSRVASTKTRQAVIGRAPEALALHINRSQFDENTGAQTKNFANVGFPKTLNLGPWYLGQVEAGQPLLEEWNTNPTVSMVPPFKATEQVFNSELNYRLRAAVTHYGRHEDGHYVCYRQCPDQELDERDQVGRWWRLSDEEVSEVSGQDMCHQDGVFMLFYERVKREDSVCASSEQEADTEAVEISETVAATSSAEPMPMTMTPATISQSQRGEILPTDRITTLATAPDTPTISAEAPKTEGPPHLIPQALLTPPPSP